MPTPIFDRIPMTQDLIKNDGQAGVEYAIVDTANIVKAHQEGWERLSPPTVPFLIKGPKGTAACDFLGRGKPIKGQTIGTTISPLAVDREIREKTGLVDPKCSTPTDSPSASKAK